MGLMDKEFADFIWDDILRQVSQAVAIYGVSLTLYWTLIG